MVGKTTIFLAGSIEMGKAAFWQNQMCEELVKIPDRIIFNPRRPDWDSSWKQSVDEPKFVEQVEWELDYLTNAHIVLFYFDPNTIAPISLLELGLVRGRFKNEIIVCCPDGYFRKGNVDIFCKQFFTPMVNSLEEMLDYVNGGYPCR